MFERISSLFDFRLALLLNFVAILAALLSGPFFLESGLVQVVAVLYIFLGFMAVAARHIDDRFLRRFLEQATSLALIIFACAHLFVYLWQLYSDSVSSDGLLLSLVNLHLAGLIVILLGAEFVIKIYKRDSSRGSLWVLSILAALSVAATPFFITQEANFSIGSSGVLPYLLLLAFAGIFTLGFTYLLRLRALVPVLKKFAEHFLGAFVFMGVAAIIVVFKSVIISNLEVPYYTVAYSAYFMLYTSMAFLYLTGTERFSNVSQLYKEVENYARPSKQESRTVSSVKKVHRRKNKTTTKI
jgi:hypothetical protein